MFALLAGGVAFAALEVHARRADELRARLALGHAKCADAAYRADLADLIAFQQREGKAPTRDPIGSAASSSGAFVQTAHHGVRDAGMADMAPH